MLVHTAQEYPAEQFVGVGKDAVPLTPNPEGVGTMVGSTTVSLGVRVASYPLGGLRGCRCGRISGCYVTRCGLKVNCVRQVDF